MSHQKSRRRSGIAFGLIVITYGVLFLLRAMNVYVASWLFQWEVILIAVGIVSLVKHKFRKVFGYALILIASLFLLNDWYPDMINMKVVWPLIFIILGLCIITKSLRKPKHRFKEFGHDFHRKTRRYKQGIHSWDEVSKNDFVDAVSFFSGLKRSVISKNFRGADIVTFFGGCELNLSQADFEGEIIMDITNIFGGTELTVPPNWVIKSEIMTIAGSVEDKRPVEMMDFESGKVVILRGTCAFGGIDINSFAK